MFAWLEKQTSTKIYTSDFINNMDHVHISGTEPSTVILMI